MSTINDTVIPGLNPQQGQPMPRTAGYYPAQSGFSTQSTVIPGVMPFSVQQSQVNSNRQVFGFLFSVSKSAAGEYWPLLLGANVIGRGADNNVNLQEASVSELHAAIHVISRSGKLLVYIRDDQSKTGTLLNGELLRGEADLQNGDIITIGENYELLVILINPIDFGLSTKSEFKDTTPTQSSPLMSNIAGMSRMAAPHIPIVTPSTGMKTVVEGSVQAGPTSGHTVIMGGQKH